MKLNSWLETGLDGDILLTPYVPKGITGYDDDDDMLCSPLPFVVSLPYCNIQDPDFFLKIQQGTKRSALSNTISV